MDLGFFYRIHLLLCGPHLCQHDHNLLVGNHRRSGERGGRRRVSVPCQRGFVRGPRLPRRPQPAAFLMELIFYVLIVHIVDSTFYY